MTRAAPRVSVLLPVRDAASTLDACLASLLGQSLQDFEVLAVDDGSRDASGERLAAAAQRDARIVRLCSPRPGLVPALNAALAAARAPLLARMDADDVASPRRLESQAERFAAEPGLDILGCRVELIEDPVSPAPGMRAYVAWQNALLDHEAIVRDVYVESPLVHPSVMLRAGRLRELGGYREFPGPEDYDLWLRALRRGCRFAKLEETLLRWRDRPSRLTRTDPRYAPARFFELKLEALEQDRLPPGRPVVVWGAGPRPCRWARALRERGHPTAAFVEVDERKLGQRIHGASVLAPRDAGLHGPLHLAAVGQKGARERIRAAAAGLGLAEGRDFVAVA